MNHGYIKNCEPAQFLVGDLVDMSSSKWWLTSSSCTQHCPKLPEVCHCRLPPAARCSSSMSPISDSGCWAPGSNVHVLRAMRLLIPG
jgi:hypothetical protein